MKQPIMRNLPQIIIVVVIVAVGASIVIGQLGLLAPKTEGKAVPSSSARPSSASAAPATSFPSAARTATTRSIAVRVSEVKRASLSNYTKLHGDVVSATEVRIFPNVAGKLMETKVAVGDRLEKGAVIALIDPSKIGQNYLPNPVESTVAGTVLSLPLQAGDTVSTNTVVATIGDLSKLRIATAVPERFVSQLKIGGFAELSFDALPGLIFSARISSLSPVLDPISRTREILLTLDKHDPRILVGMFSTVKLVTEMKSAVITAPRNAVILATDESYVYVLKEDESRGLRVEKRVVTLGMEGEDSFEIRKGLVEGEKVVTDGSSSVVDGDSVRVINGKDGMR
jgi:multidrug efflux pump subunit AcrA (membrane-fusion protein)